MGPLRKKTHKHRPAEDSIMDKAAHAVARTIIHGQEKVARLLGRKFMALTRRAKLCSLLLFCLLYGGTCLWLLGQAMRTNPGEAIVPAVRRTGPGYIERPIREKTSLPPDQHSKELQQIRDQQNAFSQPVEARSLRDRIQQPRPGRQDSINSFEQLHQKHSSLLK